MLKINQRKLEKLFQRRLLANGLVRRMYQSWSPRLDYYELTHKGDECFREMQVAQLRREKRNKDTEEQIRHYELFNRELTGKYGVQGMGKEISEASAGLREKYPHLYE